jgi:hypothetical protein
MLSIHSKRHMWVAWWQAVCTHFYTQPKVFFVCEVGTRYKTRSFIFCIVLYIVTNTTGWTLNLLIQGVPVPIKPGSSYGWLVDRCFVSQQLGALQPHSSSFLTYERTPVQISLQYLHWFWNYQPLGTVLSIYGTGTPLPPKHPILYIFSTNIRTEFFKHSARSSFFSLQNAVYFIMLPFLVPVLFAIYIQSVLKF